MTLMIFISALLAPAAAAQTPTGTAPVTGVSAAPAPIVQPSTGPAQTASNPWVMLPAAAPYRQLAEELKAEAKPGEQSPLNPSCEGKTGDECVRSEEQPKR